MHCPRCGQQQISNDTRFCSRCGLPLDLVAEVVANEGTLPQLEDLFQKNGKWLTRKNGFKLSILWFVLITLLLAPLAGITGAPEEFVGSLVLFGFVGTLFIVLLSWMFLPKVKSEKLEQLKQTAENVKTQFLGGRQSRSALPPQQSVPVSSYMPPAGSWRDTNDLQATSVTEGTTKIINENR